jgi:hypothetical protein
MKFLVRKEARSPYRKGKIIAAQTEDLKRSPRNKRERKHFHKEILKKTNKCAQRRSPHTGKRIQKRIKALPDINKTRSLLTSSS